MPGPSDTCLGNLRNTFVLNLQLSPAACGANNTTVQTFPCPGLLTTDQISAVGKPTFQAGLAITGSACFTNGVLSIQFLNVTGASITPTASEYYVIEINRPTNVVLPVGIV